MLKLYIFDMGGVVTRNTNIAPLISDHLALDEDPLKEVAGDDFKALTIGIISAKEFSKRFSLKIGRTLEEGLLTRIFRPKVDRDVLKTVASLKKNARVVVGTNTIAPHYGIHLRKGHYEAFDAVYASHLMGLAKPHPAFYRYILDREHCLPGEAVFVDDLPANVEAARELGIHSFVFVDPETLTKDLAAFNT
jgi:HAD superfamily hydrolase (TIGR01509 family)